MKKKISYTKQLEKRIEELENVINSLGKSEIKKDKLAFKIIDYWLRKHPEPGRVGGPSALLDYNPFIMAELIIDGKTMAEFKERCLSKKP